MKLQLRPVPLLVAAAGFGLLFLVAERFHRRGVPAESTRRAAHATGGAGTALAQAILTLPELVALAVAFTGFLVATRAFGGLHSIHQVDRPTAGALLFPAGLLLAVIAGWQHPAAIAFGILVLAFADPLAAMAGRGRRLGWDIPGGHKSLPGSAAFLITSLLIGGLFTIIGGRFQPLAAVGVAVALTLVEAIAGFGLDNLVLPALGTLAARAWLAL